LKPVTYIGHLEVVYHDISMALGAQETITDANHSLSFDVHLQETMDFISPRVDALWWALDDNQTEAEVFIANTRATQTVATPTFYVDGVAYQGEAITLNGRESSVIDIKQSLQRLHISTAAVGGLSLSYTNGPGAVAIVGVLKNKHTGFSTTVRFIDQATQMSTHLHGANILIGRPAPDSGFASIVAFTPHVIVRNTTDQPVQITSRIKYTLNEQSNNIELAELTLTPNAVRELDLSPAINAIDKNVITDSGIEIDHNGSHGAVMAYAASIDRGGSAVFDVPVKDPTGDMGFKGGSYPWNIEGDNRAVLHVKSIDVPGDGRKQQFMVKLFFEGGEYNLPLQQVDPGQTAVIDIRKLRDDQVPDGLGNKIPLSVTSGQLDWDRRAKRGSFIGRLLQYNPVTGLASSFSCFQYCWCDPSIIASWVLPTSHDGEVGDVYRVEAWEEDEDCNHVPMYPYVVPNPNWYTSDPSVVDVYDNYAYVVGYGDAFLYADWSAWLSAEQPDPSCEFEPSCPDLCAEQPSGGSGEAEVKVLHVNNVAPGRGVRAATTHVIITGTSFTSGATVNVGGDGITVSNKTVNSSTSINADFVVAANAGLGNHSVSVSRGGKPSNSVNFYVQVPSKLLPYTDSNLAPNGIGPLRTPVHEDLTYLEGALFAHDFCGVARSYLFFLADQDGQRIQTAFHFDEIFSNIFKSAPGLADVTYTPVDFPANYVAIEDLQSLGFQGGCLQTDEYETFTQKFKITINGTEFLPTTTIDIKRGNEGGTLKVERTISTP